MIDWDYWDGALTESEKWRIYIALPMEVDEDSVSVEYFLEHRWARLLTHDDLDEFTAAFQRWVLEGMPL